MKIIGVIPARYHSTRLPGKPLADICGKPMIWWVYQNARKVKELDEVYVATDDVRIEEACKQFGAKVVMTASDLETGTDRVYEVAKLFEADFYVVINGDEPLIPADCIAKCIPSLELNPPDIYVSNLMTDFHDPVEVLDPTNLKIVTNRDGIGLFISRSPIPFPRGNMDYTFHKFVGVSVFSKAALDYYMNTPRGPIEKIEENDSFRFIENRLDVHYISVECHALSVDTPKDLEQVCAILKGASGGV